MQLHEVKVEPEGTRFFVTGTSGDVSLRFLHEVSVRASDTLPATIDAVLSFRGYCSKAEIRADMHGVIAVRCGAFDDAARLAALVRLAEWHHGEGFRRSVKFAAFTGEEKGLYQLSLLFT